MADAVSTTIASMGREYAQAMMPLEQRLARSASSERLTTTLAVSIAAIAVLLAFIGVYSLLAYAVARRTREIGVRVALGAMPRDVLRLVIGEGAALTLLGVLIGIPAAVAAARVLGSLMFGVSASDPLTLSAAAAFFLVLGIGAGLLPARRAATIDPVKALRTD